MSAAKCLTCCVNAIRGLKYDAGSSNCQPLTPMPSAQHFHDLAGFSKYSRAVQPANRKRDSPPNWQGRSKGSQPVELRSLHACFVEGLNVPVATRLSSRAVEAFIIIPKTQTAQLRLTFTSIYSLSLPFSPRQQASLGTPQSIKRLE